MIIWTFTYIRVLFFVLFPFVYLPSVTTCQCFAPPSSGKASLSTITISRYSWPNKKQDLAAISNVVLMLHYWLYKKIFFFKWRWREVALLFTLEKREISLPLHFFSKFHVDHPPNKGVTIKKKKKKGRKEILKCGTWVHQQNNENSQKLFVCVWMYSREFGLTRLSWQRL